MKGIYLLLFLFIIETHSENLSWKPLNLNVGEIIYQIEPLNEHDLIFKTNSGLYLVEDLNKVKRIDTLISDSAKITFITISPDNYLYAGTSNQGLFLFNQENFSWKNVTYNLDDLNIYNIAIGKNNEITVISYNAKNELSISKRQLQDTIWNKLNTNEKIKMDYLKYNDFGELFGSFYSYLYKFVKHDDTTYNWVAPKNIIEQIPPGNLRGFHFEKGKYYILGENSGINISLDSGKTFNNHFDGLAPFGGFNKITISTKGEIVISSKYYGVFFSNDGGMNFERTNEGLEKINVNTFSILNDGRVVLCIANKSLFYCEPPTGEPVKKIGWKQEDGYKTRHSSRYGVTFLKISNDGKSIFTVSANEFREWDEETGYLKRLHKFDLKKTLKIMVTDDDKYILAVYKSSKNMSEYDDTVNIRIEILDINNFELLKYTDYVLIKQTRTPNKLAIIRTHPRYFPENNTLYFNFTYSISSDGTGGTIYRYYGDLIKYEFLEDTTTMKILYSIPINDYIITEDKKIFLSYFQGSNVIYSDNDFATSKVIYNQEKDPSLKPGSFNKLDYFQETNTLICGTKEAMYSLNLDSNKLYELINFDKRFWGMEPFPYIFNKGRNKVIAGLNHGIFILKYPEMKVIDSTLLKSETMYNWIFALTPDSSGFVVGNYSGMIMYFRSNSVSNVEEYTNHRYSNSDNNVLIYPNPAKDFVFIDAQDISNIIISDLNGKIINPTINYSANQAIINTKHLNAGIYFINITLNKKVINKSFIKFE